MADIRIKDLTTTASSSASDDFIAVDGTTNGTRKLSAFSPTFGGNATVTGTLTVNGTTASVGAGTGSIISKLNGAAGSYKLSIYQSAGVDRWYAGLAAGAESGSDGGAPYSIVALTDAGAVIDNALLITRAAGGSITTPRPVSISATTASTTTSSGALVVSGGVGVGGSINTGGTLRFNTNANLPGVGSMGISAIYGLNMYASTGSSYDFTLFNAAGNSLILNPTGTQNLTLPGTLTVNGVATAGSYLTSAAGLAFPGALSASGYYLYSGSANGLTMYGYGSTYDVYIGNRAGTRALSVAANSTVVSIPDTTASTSTSSGALVVSGGVGVGGAIVAGGALHTTGNGTGGPYLASSANFDFASGQARFYGRGANTSTRATLGFYSTYSDGTGGITLQTFDTSGNATFAGAISIGNTVNTVSPTSPNRTITMVIGGTTYYLAAKTTND